MFFFISKIFHSFLNPFVWILTLFTWYFFAKNKSRKKKILVFTLVIIYTFSNSFLFNKVMHLWEYPAFNENTITKPFDVGIVLGGGMVENDPAMGRVNFRGSTDRFLQTLGLYKTKKIKKILLVGGDARLFKNDEIESVMLKKYFILLGIPDSDIVVETKSINTFENAKFTKPILENKFKNCSYLLITSGYHIRRALGCFKKIGLNPIPYSTDRRSGPDKYDLDFLLIPDVGILCSWNGLFHEWFGYITYFIMGYI